MSPNTFTTLSTFGLNPLYFTSNRLSKVYIDCVKYRKWLYGCGLWPSRGEETNLGKSQGDPSSLKDSRKTVKVVGFAHPTLLKKDNEGGGLCPPYTTQERQ